MLVGNEKSSSQEPFLFKERKREAITEIEVCWRT
jgi:hypothetical protein